MASTDRRNNVSPGLGMKAPVIAASTANLTLESTQTIDGIGIKSNYRVLAKDQTDPIENGIWLCQAGSWVREIDWNGLLDVKTGTAVMAALGTVNGGKIFRVTSTSTAIEPGVSSVALSTTN